MEINLNEMHLSVIVEATKERVAYLESRISTEGEGTAEWAAPELAEAQETLRAINRQMCNP